MSFVPTKTVFRAFLSNLKADLSQWADAFERFDGDPELAVYEHVVVLDKPTGSSVLVGYNTKRVGQRDASRWIAQGAMAIAILAIRRRGGIDTTTEDAEALDDLQDAIEWVVNPHNPARKPQDFNCAAIEYDIILPLDGGDSWLGRSVNLIVYKHEVRDG